MQRAKALAVFMLRLAVIDALLIAPWFGAGSAYRAAFIAGGNMAFHWFGPHRSVQFHEIVQPSDALDVDMTLMNTNTRERATMPLSSRYFGFMPTAFVIALMLATPLRWRRRIITLICGAIVVSGLVLARVLVTVFVNFSPADHPGLISMSAAMKSILLQVDSALSVPLVGWFVMPLVIWIALVFRGDDRALLKSNDQGD